jgi:hypothetical protein
MHEPCSSIGKFGAFSLIDVAGRVCTVRAKNLSIVSPSRSGLRNASNPAMRLAARRALDFRAAWAL